MNGMHLGIYPIETGVHRVLFYFDECGGFQYWTGRNVLHSFAKISNMMTGVM